MKFASIARFLFVAVLLVATALTVLVVIYYFIQQNTMEQRVTSKIRTTSSSTNLVPDSSTSSTNGLNVNLIVNGAAEDGPCEMNTDVTHPTVWDYVGQITQMSYNSTNFQSVTFDAPGPPDRGSCYFSGLRDPVTSMWQSINLTTAINRDRLSDDQLEFELSAWLGGWSTQEDNARVILTFFDNMSMTATDPITLGPVTALDRNGVTSMVYREIRGLVPTGAASVLVRVVLTRLSETVNDGCIDNIVLILHRGIQK